MKHLHWEKYNSTFKHQLLRSIKHFYKRIRSLINNQIAGTIFWNVSFKAGSKGWDWWGGSIQVPWYARIHPVWPLKQTSFFRWFVANIGWFVVTCQKIGIEKSKQMYKTSARPLKKTGENEVCSGGQEEAFSRLALAVHCDESSLYLQKRLCTFLFKSWQENWKWSSCPQIVLQKHFLYKSGLQGMIWFD